MVKTLCFQGAARRKSRRFLFHQLIQRNAKAPLQLVVSDMTVLKSMGKQWEWTLLPDTFNNEIIAHSVSPIAGDNKPHYQKMKADAEAGDPEAIRRYEATLAKRRDEYHKKKSRQEEVPA